MCAYIDGQYIKSEKKPALCLNIPCPLGCLQDVSLLPRINHLGIRVDRWRRWLVYCVDIAPLLSNKTAPCNSSVQTLESHARKGLRSDSWGWLRPAGGSCTLVEYRVNHAWQHPKPTASQAPWFIRGLLLKRLSRWSLCHTMGESWMMTGLYVTIRGRLDECFLQFPVWPIASDAFVNN